MKLELNNPDNWERIFEKNVSALKITSSRHSPIPDIKADVDVDRRIVAVEVISINAKNTWKWGGFFNQEVNSVKNALGVNSASITKRRIWLNQLNLLIFPEYTVKYRMSFTVPDYFKDISLKVWKYIGVEVNEADNLLLEIRQEELQRIESKIDDLSEYGR